MINAIIIFIVGLIIGSFLNVLICRLPDIESIIKTRSHCPNCKHKLYWYDLIPVISFVMLGRKCRYCKGKISWQYPLVELVTALLFILIYLEFGLTLSAIYLMLISCVLIVIFVYDQIRQIIPDSMVIIGLALSLIYYCLSVYHHHYYYHYYYYYYYDFEHVILGIVIPIIFLGSIVFFTKGKGIGVGDVKLAALLGLMLGYPLIIVGLFMAFIIGALFGLILIIAGKKKMKDTIAFGPFLIIGFYIAFFWGYQIINWCFGM